MGKKHHLLYINILIFGCEFSCQVAEVSDAQGSMLVIGRPVEDGSILG